MDRASIKKWVLVFGVLVGNLWIPTDADACLLRWWRRRRAERNAVYYPTATMPTTAAASCGPATCQQTVVQYVPQTAFRTVWQAVPVTTHRRTVSYNPSTGLPITCTQPCTTYTYQARRVPYTTLRPVYRTVPVTAATSTVAVPSCNSCATTTTAAPYYTPSTTSVPSAVAPAPTAGSVQGATEWEPVPGAGMAPASPATGTPSPADDPASDRPRIDQNSNGFSSLRRMPSTAPRNTWTNSSPADRYFRPNAPSQVTRVDNPAPQQNSIMTTPNQGSSRNVDIRPIPRIDQLEPQQGEAPPLLNAPRDNTALLSTRWASNRIRWPERQVSHTVEVSQTAQPPAHRTRRLEPRRIDLQKFDSDSQRSGANPWDDSGWHSANR